MEYRDLREWISKAEGLEEVKTLKKCDWNLEIGAITELVARREDGPAVLFDEIKDYPKGYRVLSNSLSSRKRLALTLDMPAGETKMDFVRLWRERYKKIKPIPPKFVKDSPLLENVYRDKDIDLLKFPTPKWHELDGGRYIGTGSIDITRDPDEGWVNWGTYRVMIHDKDTVGFYISPGKHGRIQREKYISTGRPCKIAMSFGHDPLVFLAGSIEVPYAIPEYEFIGGVRGEPLELIEGEYSGLPIPANAEIVVEGDVIFDQAKIEGPFGEWTGYYASAERPEPFVKVRRLYHRNNPIMLGSPPGRPPAELGWYRSYLRSALIWDEMEKAGVPDVKGVWLTVSGGSRLVLVVSIKQRYPGHAKQAAVVASQCHAGAYLGRYVIVVDDDIDPSNTDDMIWALASRSDPETDIDIIRRCWSGPLDPIIQPGKKGFNSRAIIDACRPFEWIKDFPPVAESSKEVLDATARKWGKILFSSNGKA
ncbi:MAG: UbiD family decarboxylase [Deltaproteobacteria bacterium]|nr:UbiD family decarboxylase [Deltaproteobacteria bacterium]MBI2349694.1 UbiD family decarboxylase [Deltaproteobacteria bacterium]MBI2540067.1 UbiD family decarboxylase [Deltaproteobacteria bacterium]MBI3060674.1 UbiD family decarboxylase [Deltaproteobacteria bacterium]